MGGSVVAGWMEGIDSEGRDLVTCGEFTRDFLMSLAGPFLIVRQEYCLEIT